MPYAPALNAARCALTNSRNNTPRSEIRWMHVFATPPLVTGDEMRSHKAAWKIQGVPGGRWNDVAAVVQRHVAAAPPTNPVDVSQRVAALAEDLGRAAPLCGRQPIHISWATKILIFAWPAASIHVWDSKARTVLGGGRRNFPVAGPPAQRYQNFHVAAEERLAFELLNPQFTQALNLLRASVARLQNIPGFQPLVGAVAQGGLGNFLERRLLDKILWFSAA